MSRFTIGWVLCALTLTPAVMAQDREIPESPTRGAGLEIAFEASLRDDLAKLLDEEAKPLTGRVVLAADRARIEAGPLLGEDRLALIADSQTALLLNPRRQLYSERPLKLLESLRQSLPLPDRSGTPPQWKISRRRPRVRVSSFRGTHGRSLDLVRSDGSRLGLNLEVLSERSQARLLGSARAESPARFNELVAEALPASESLAAAFRELPGPIVGAALYASESPGKPLGRQPIASFRVTRIRPYAPLSEDFEIPEGFKPQGRHEAKLRPGFELDLAPPAALLEALEPEPGFQFVDAGIALTPSLLQKAGVLASSLADALDPLKIEPELPPVFKLDWFMELRRRMDPNLFLQFDAADPADVARASDFWAGVFSAADQEPPEALEIDLKDGDLLASMVPVDCSVVSPWASPQNQEYGPGAPVNCRSWNIHDKFSIRARNVALLLNVDIFGISPQLDFADDILSEVSLDEDVYRTALSHDELSVGFGFLTSPGSHNATAALCMVTLGISCVASLNLGLGSYWLEDSEALFETSIEAASGEGQPARLSHATRFLADESSVHSNLFMIGLNPVSDILDLIVSIGASLGDAGVGEMTEKVTSALDSLLTLLDFPNSFTAGNHAFDIEQFEVGQPFGAPRRLDGADAFLAAPELADLVEQDSSRYYRGIYDVAFAEGLPEALELDAEADGSYVFHKQVLEEMILARLAADGLPIPEDVPATGPANLTGFERLGPDMLATLAEAGYLSPGDAQAWADYLDDVALWIDAFYALQNVGGDAFPDRQPGEVLLRSPARRRRRVEVGAGNVRIDWPASLSGLPVESPLAPVEVSIEAQYRESYPFREATTGDVLSDFFDMIEGLSPVPLSPGIVRPQALVSQSPADLEVDLGFSGELFIGLGSPPAGSIFPAIPPSFEFSIDNQTPAQILYPSSGGSILVVRCPSILISNCELRQALADELSTLAPERLRKSPRQRVRYFSHPVLEDPGTEEFFGFPFGAHWRVVDAADEELLVRTTDQRLYLDFEIDLPIVDFLAP